VAVRAIIEEVVGHLGMERVLARLEGPASPTGA
jgi:hypothetical protein